MVRIEKETVIIYNEVNEPVNIFTYDQSLINRSDLYCEKYPEEGKLIGSNSEGAKEYLVSKQYFSIRVNAPLTEERREALSKAMKERMSAIKSNE